MNQFNQAILKATDGFKAIVNDSHQDRRGQKIPYASLHAVVNSIQTSLIKNDVRTETHFKRRKDDWFDVITTIVHIPSNESKKFHYETKLSDPTNNQERGAAITYGRRYNLLSAFNLTIEKDADDNDGHVEVKQGSVGEMLKGFEAEQVQLLVEITNELNSAATHDELMTAWREKSKARKDDLKPLTKSLLTITLDQRKKDFLDAA